MPLCHCMYPVSPLVAVCPTGVLPCLAPGMLAPEKLCHPYLLSHCHLTHLSCCPRGPRTALPLVQEHAEPQPRQIKTRPAKATLLLNEHIRLGFSAFAGRDSHL